MSIVLVLMIVLVFPVAALAQSADSVEPSPGVRGTTQTFESDALHYLRAFTLATSEDTILGGQAAMLLGLAETNRSVPTKQVSVALTDEIRFFTVSLVPNSDDIILTIKKDAAVQRMYLTNSKFLLRVAVVHENGPPHIMSNEEAAAGFEALCMFWIERSKSLQTGQTGHVH